MPGIVILSEAKNLIVSSTDACEILRLTPQNDVVGPPLWVDLIFADGGLDSPSTSLRVVSPSTVLRTVSLSNGLSNHGYPPPVDSGMTPWPLNVGAGTSASSAEPFIPAFFIQNRKPDP
jgi:hypothetical protein